MPAKPLLFRNCNIFDGCIQALLPREENFAKEAQWASEKSARDAGHIGINLTRLARTKRYCLQHYPIPLPFTNPVGSPILDRRHGRHELTRHVAPKATM